eukprot:g4520.t1
MVAAVILLQVLLPFVPLAERAGESLKTAESLRHDPEEEDSLQGNWVESEDPFPIYASTQNRAAELKKLSLLLKKHVDPAGPLQKSATQFRESDQEYSDAAHGLFKSLNKFQDSISEFRGKVADANSHKVDTIKEKMSAKLPGVRGPHPQDEYSEVDDEAYYGILHHTAHRILHQEWKKSQWKEARENEKKSRKTENEVGASAMETDEHQKDWSGLNSGAMKFFSLADLATSGAAEVTEAVGWMAVWRIR